MIPETAKLKTDELSREELIVLIYEMAQKIDELEEQLRVKQPPTTSQNSSQPPSRDFKAEKEKRKRSRQKGAKPGHEKQERQSVEKPNKVIEAYVDNCKNCHLNLLDQVPVQVIRRQVTELPEIKPVVIETRQYGVDCPCCGERQHGKLPEGLEAGRYFGPRLEATVTNLHHEHPIGYKRLLQICDELFGLRLSPGGAVSMGSNLLERYRKYCNSLFIFLHRTDVPAHNNTCERALRPSVIHRKVLGSFRSDWGAQAYASLATVLNTAKRNGQNAFQKLVQLMGTPVLPFFQASNKGSSRACHFLRFHW